MGAQRKENFIDIDSSGVVRMHVGVRSWPNAVTLLDVADLPLVQNGTTRWRAARSGRGKNPYVVRREAGEWQSLHRLVLGLTDPHDIADHINGDTLDNRRINLRKATRLENARNQSGWHHKRLPKGVTQHHRMFLAAITVERRRIHLGSYQTVAEAVAAYDAAAKVAFGDFARPSRIAELRPAQ